MSSGPDRIEPLRWSAQIDQSFDGNARRKSWAMPDPFLLRLGTREALVPVRVFAP